LFKKITRNPKAMLKKNIMAYIDKGVEEDIFKGSSLP
jgi:hypothetical protein